jgi:hypothetical protein
MTLFPTALALKPDAAAVPSDDFLANFVTGRQTWLAVVRRGFGADFKNFQNYALGRVQTTPAVHRRLLDALDGDEQTLEVLAGSMREGVLVGQLSQVLRTAEGAIFQLMRLLASGPVRCVNCGANLISDPAHWWGKQACALGEPEYRFVDRILYDLIAAATLPAAFLGVAFSKESAVDALIGLCEPGAHPFRHWLDRARAAWRAKDLTALATRAGMTGPSPDSHLQRCSRGEMLTVETIDQVTARLANRKPLRQLGMQSRVLAFLVDFMVAADSGDNVFKPEHAQAIVKERLAQLRSDLLLGYASARDAVPRLVSTET